jgi:hypothetical protein
MDRQLSPKPDQPLVIKWLLAGALGLLIVSNIGWLLAYSALSQKTVAVTTPAPSASASVAPSASPTPTPPTKGTISGNVGYPAGTAPAQTVCAVSVSNSSLKYCVDFPGGNSLAYTLSVPAGTYYVYASLKTAQGDFTTSYKAYYNKYVTCQTEGNCAMGLHTQYVPVAVTAGGSSTGINPTDWYALSVGQ